VAGLDDWCEVSPQRGVLSMTGLPEGGIVELQRHLDSSLAAVHTSFSFFDQKWRLGWMLSA